MDYNYGYDYSAWSATGADWGTDNSWMTGYAQQQWGTADWSTAGYMQMQPQNYCAVQPGAQQEEEQPQKKDWDLKYEERAGGKDEKLDRHRDARRSMKPAWMTKGVGCGTDMFGKPTGIIKPGDDVKKEIKPRDPNEPDPMGDVYRSVVKDAKDGKDVALPPETAMPPPTDTAVTSAPAPAPAPVPEPNGDAPAPDAAVAPAPEAAPAAEQTGEAPVAPMPGVAPMGLAPTPGLAPMALTPPYTLPPGVVPVSGAAPVPAKASMQQQPPPKTGLEDMSTAAPTPSPAQTSAVSRSDRRSRRRSRSRRRTPSRRRSRRRSHRRSPSRRRSRRRSRSRSRRR